MRQVGIELEHVSSYKSLLYLVYDIEVGHAGLDHQHVRSLGRIQRCLDQCFSAVGRVLR